MWRKKSERAQRDQRDFKEKKKEKKEHQKGLEPSTFGLGGRRATIAPLVHFWR
jgi:hypothetical protein